MFEQIKAAEAAQKPDLQEFLALYAKFQAGARWLAERKAKGLDNTNHMPDFRKLEAQVDQAWESIPESKKDEALLLLAQKKAVSQEVLDAKEMFSGKLVKIT